MADTVLVVPLIAPPAAVYCPMCGLEILVAPAAAPIEIAATVPHHLTTRQREVLRAIADGGSTKSIARLLGIGTSTVETYRYQIMDRLDLHSVAELTRYACRHEGVVP